MNFSIGQGLFILYFPEDIDDGSIPPVFVLFDPDLFANFASYCGSFSFFLLNVILFIVVIIVVSHVELVLFLPAVLFLRLRVILGEVERPPVNQLVAPRGQFGELKRQLVSHSPSQAGKLPFFIV